MNAKLTPQLQKALYDIYEAYERQPPASKEAKEVEENLQVMPVDFVVNSYIIAVLNEFEKSIKFLEKELIRRKLGSWLAPRDRKTISVDSQLVKWVWNTSKKNNKRDTIADFYDLRRGIRSNYRESEDLFGCLAIALALRSPYNYMDAVIAGLKEIINYCPTYGSELLRPNIMHMIANDTKTAEYISWVIDLVEFN